MNMSVKIFALFLALLFCNKLSIVEAKKLLKLRAVFGKAEPTRTVKLDVNVQYLDKANVQQNVKKENVKNGQKFDIKLSNVAETAANFELEFFFYIKPIKNEYSADIEEKDNPLDKAPYTDPHYNNLKMKDIRTMFRMISVKLYSPDLSKRYTVNLGQADPPGLFLNRRVFFETNNVIKTGIYYAFLCATATKHRRHGYSADKKYFLGYAPLLLNPNNNDGIALSLGAAEHQRRTQNLSKFKVSIPVKLEPIFKHILWFLNLNIYHFDKVIAKENDFGDMSKYCLKENWVKSVENDSNRASVGHPNLVLSQNFPPLFDGSPNILFDLHANPMAELLGIASESANEFKRRSARQAIKNIEEQMNLTEKNLKIIMKHLGFGLMDGQKLFEIAKMEIVKSGETVENIQKLLKTSNTDGTTIQNAKQALNLIESFKKLARSEAIHALDSMQMISEH